MFLFDIKFVWNMAKAFKNCSHRLVPLMFPLENRWGASLDESLPVSLFAAWKQVRGQVKQRKGGFPKLGNPRPRLVPMVIICVIIPALGYQSSRTGVTEFVEMASVVGKKKLSYWAVFQKITLINITFGNRRYKCKYWNWKAFRGETVWEHFTSFIKVKRHFSASVWSIPFAWTFNTTYHTV